MQCQCVGEFGHKPEDACHGRASRAVLCWGSRDASRSWLPRPQIELLLRPYESVRWDLAGFGGVRETRTDTEPWTGNCDILSGLLRQHVAVVVTRERDAWRSGEERRLRVAVRGTRARGSRVAQTHSGNVWRLFPLLAWRLRPDGCSRRTEPWGKERSYYVDGYGKFDQA